MTFLHWLQAFLFKAYLAFLGLFSVKISSRISGNLLVFLGMIFGPVGIARRNLELCFPDMVRADIENIIRGMWYNLGAIVGEINHFASMNREEFFEFFEFCDYTNGEIYKPGGGIILSAHYGNWEILPRFMYENNVPVFSVYRPSNNKFFDRIINNIRIKNKIQLIKKGTPGLKKIMGAIKNNYKVGVLIDQRSDDGVESNFFNMPAPTAIAPIKIAIKLHVPIYLMLSNRLSKARYLIDIIPIYHPINNNLNDNVEDIIRSVHNNLEKAITQNPSNWMWVHRRWKKEQYK